MAQGLRHWIDEEPVLPEITRTHPKPGLGQMRLLRLASQSMPTGAFAYSSGMETALELGHIEDATGAAGYLTSLGQHVLGNLELPLLVRMLVAFQTGDHRSATRWSRTLLASRESREMQAQDGQMGRALARVLADLYPGVDSGWRPHTYAEAFARGAVACDLDLDSALVAYSYGWVEQHVTALARLLPLGPLAMQRLLHTVTEDVAPVLDHAKTVDDQDIGAGCPRLALACALHETQYTRLFRS